MRPIMLSVQAFGPYANTQMFDFRQLGAHTLFLIHGDTGAGKSTILDAICYALYGDTSGGERSGRELRSHHAPPYRPTSVRFDFALGQALYRIARSPEHERPKQRGSGTTTVAQSASLWLRSGCADDSQPGEILAERWDEVNRRVIELLGFECGQFRQVVVLPQGQFRDFLVAPSTEREAILQVLFKTDDYQRIERAMKDASSKLGQQVNTQDQMLRQLYQQAGVQNLDALLAERSRREGQLAALRGSLAALRQAAERAQAQLQAGQQTQAKLAALAEARQTLAGLVEQQTQIEELRAEHRRGQRAADLADIRQALGQRQQEARDAEQARDQAAERHQEALATRDQARLALEQEEQRAPAREEARTALDRLARIAEQIDTLEEAQRRLQHAVQEAETHTKELATLQSTLATHQQAFKTAAEAWTGLREEAAQLEARTLRLSAAQERREQRGRLEELRALLVAAGQQAAETEAQVRKTEQTYEQARERLADIERHWLAGQAGVLAQQLAAGAPCPVCGSRDHPHPAALAPDQPTEASLKRQRDALRKQEQAREQARQTHQEHQQQLTRLQEQHSALTERLGEHHATALAELQSAYEQAKLAAEQAAAAAQTLPEQEQARQAAEQQLDATQRQIELLGPQHRDAEQRRAAALAVLRDREASIPEALRTRAELERAQEAAQQASAALEQALEQAHSTLLSAENQLTASSSTQEALALAAQQATERAEEQQRRFLERLAEQGFADLADYQRAIRTADALAELARRIDTHDQAVALAQNKLADAQRAAEGLEPPDLTTLEAAARQTREDLETALRQEATLNTELTQHTAWCEDAEKRSAAIEALRQRFSVIGHIARVAGGENIYKMSFQRFVLAALLDEVLFNASHRLQAMSSGRYTLQRVLNQADRRRAGGLELEVSDLYTGRSRLAKTLSGGESFLASLALALGLADVVQTHTGGIQLETMFIDEGFGSLDERTLEQALSTLAELQRGGRLVGIISHVAELQRRITARLEVTATPSGSSARFVLGAVS
jgi:exonuclease SbcC